MRPAGTASLPPLRTAAVCTLLLPRGAGAAHRLRGPGPHLREVRPRRRPRTDLLRDFPAAPAARHAARRRCWRAGHAAPLTCRPGDAGELFEMAFGGAPALFRVRLSPDQTHVPPVQRTARHRRRRTDAVAPATPAQEAADYPDRQGRCRSSCGHQGHRHCRHQDGLYGAMRARSSRSPFRGGLRCSTTARRTATESLCMELVRKDGVRFSMKAATQNACATWLRALRSMLQLLSGNGATL